MTQYLTIGEQGFELNMDISAYTSYHTADKKRTIIVCGVIFDS